MVRLLFSLMGLVVSDATQGLVEFRTSCVGDATICTKVKHANSLMAGFVENNLIFASKIIVLVNYTSFCGNRTACPDANTNGRGGAGKEFLFTDTNGMRQYFPQALVKQIYPETGDLNPNDVSIKINSDKPFYFPMDYKAPQPKRSMAYIDLLTHELLHGLGFLTKMMDIGEGLIVPSISFTSKGRNHVVSVRTSVFDKHICFSSGETMANYTALLNQMAFPTRPKSKSEFKDFIKASEKYPQIKRLSSYFITPNSSFILGPHNTRIILETSFDPFTSGSSLSHLDAKTYIADWDFSMTTKKKKVITSHQIIAQGQEWDSSPFGYYSLYILHTLGYNVNWSPEYNSSLSAFYWSVQ